MNVEREVDVALARLAAIVESSEDAIVGKTLDGIVTSWNRSAERLFGYSAAEMIGQSITRIIPPDLIHEEGEILAKVRVGERVDHYQTRRVTRDGRSVFVALTVSPVRDAGGRIVGASKIARDITALLEAQRDRDQLLESERAARAEAERLGVLKDEFLATLSHELRTPLNAILGWCALLKDPGFRGVDQRQAIETIERNARTQAQIIDDLLDMSRIVAGKIELGVAPQRVEELVRVAVDTIRPSAAAKQLALDVRVESTGLVVNADAARIQQVLWNLLTNAVKFTPPGGSIRVHARQAAHCAEFEVSDTGVGIPPEFLSQVFDRFRQAQSGPDRHYGGLGLGLSIARTLVELHGGVIRAHSEGGGKGACFSVRLPLLAADQQARAPLPASGLQPDRLPRLDGKSLLVVDDDDDSRTLLARVLGERGAEVYAAASAEEALKLLSAHRVNAVLSDLGMPTVDGFQFIRRLRALQANPNSDAPAIAVSAYARAEDERRALDAGFQQHVAKPYSIAHLLDVVKSATR